MNKKGNIILIAFFFIALMIILFVGFMMVVGSSILNIVFDEVIPELTNLGMVGDANMTEIAEVTVVPLNNIIQNFTWLTGVLYVLMLIASIGFAFVSRTTPNRWLIAFYFMCILILVIASIFMSSIYEEFYDGDDDLALRLHEHTILSFMILFSPMILTALAFITGIIMFSGLQQEEFV